MREMLANLAWSIADWCADRAQCANERADAWLEASKRWQARSTRWRKVQ
jgi:putative alpha-1,2-mannosidase